MGRDPMRKSTLACAVIDRIGDPGRSARNLADEVNAEEIRKYGRQLTLKERLEVLKKRMN